MIGNQWIGMYKKEKNLTVCNNIEYCSLNNFSKNHYKITSPYMITELLSQDVSDMEDETVQ